MKKNILYLIVFASVFALFSCESNDEIQYTLKIEKTVFTVGEIIKVEYTANPDWDATAWIGIVPSEIEHGQESENDA